MGMTLYPPPSGGGSSAWGGITGTLSDQVDLQGALDGKQPLSAVLTATTASYTTADNSKLAGIAAGATANSSDATLLSRANHTGSQAISTVTGLQAAIDGKQPLAAVLTGTTASYTTADQSKLAGIAAGATANSSDATLLARANHTGTQLAATISDFSTAVAATAAVTANTAKVTNATHTGEVTGSGALTITAGAVTLSKMADVATGTVFYRKTAATGVPEVQTLATLKTDLGLTGTNSGDQTITLTGMVTGSGTGSFAASLGSFTKAQLDAAVSDGNVLYVGDVTTNATHTGDATGDTALTLATVNSNVGSFGLAASVAQFTVNAKGLITAAANVAISIASAAISDSTAAGRAFLTAATAAAQTALLDVFTSGAKGLVPASGGGTTNFLRADGTFAAPPGGGGGGNAVAASLAFGGTFTDKAQTVVTGQTWVAAGSKITADVLTPTGTDPDEMYLLNFRPVISDLVNGVGFTVTLYTEAEARGTYTVNCIGV